MSLYFKCHKFNLTKEVVAWREELKLQNRKLVVATGCFDILHNGHCSYLEDSNRHGDCLLVGLDNDASIKALKGKNRPINKASNRLDVIASLRFVDAVFIYENTAQFLKDIKPDVWVKGGDYSLETLNQEELSHVVNGGGKVVFSPLINGLSSSILLSKI